MNKFSVYEFFSKLSFLGYRTKILLIAFLGIHIPLIAIILTCLIWAMPNDPFALTVIGVALGATILGTIITALTLDRMIKPVTAASQALRGYATDGTLPALPTRFSDEVGTLMSDTNHVLHRLDAVIDSVRHYDSITGLPNRDYLTQWLERKSSDNPIRLTVLVFRMKNFDHLLSAFGRPVADKMAMGLAQRLDQRPAWIDVIARLNEHCFAATSLQTLDELPLWPNIDPWLTEFTDDLMIETRQLTPEIAIGMAKHEAASARHIPQLIDDAITAAKWTEDRNRPRIQAFSRATRQALDEQLTLEQDLRIALEQQQFMLFFQPIVQLSNTPLIGVEALLRWQHPRRGLLAPSSFMATAEINGMIEPLGRWVFNRACEQAAAWQQCGHFDTKIAINISARQFRDNTFIDWVGHTMTKWNVDPLSIEMELTETAMMQDMPRTRRIFGQLQEMGVTVAIDDFGAGYSSMSYLKNLPFNCLKIDREFVDRVDVNQRSRAICKAIIELAQGMDLDVIAEGTEQASEVAELSSLGCKQFQGYYFAKPMPDEELTAYFTDPNLLRTQLTLDSNVVPIRCQNTKTSSKNPK